MSCRRKSWQTALYYISPRVPNESFVLRIYGSHAAEDFQGLHPHTMGGDDVCRGVKVQATPILRNSIIP